MGDMAEMMDFYYNGECEAYIPEVEHGFWRARDGRLFRISEITDQHLNNILNMFERNEQEAPEILLLEKEYRSTKP